MKVITFALQKGGTGKTSSSTSVVVEMALTRKKVLLIDADPQGNSTSWILDHEIDKEFVDVLMDKCSVSDAIISTRYPNLSILPTASLGGGVRSYQKTLANKEPFAVRHLVRSITDFDYVIIDTSTSFGALEKSYLLASYEALTVRNIDEFSKDGLIIFIDNLVRMKRSYDSDLPIINKLILNGRDGRLTQQADILSEIKKISDCGLYIVPVDQAFKKAQSVHVPIQFLDSTKKETLQVISSLANDIMGCGNAANGLFD